MATRAEDLRIGMRVNLTLGKVDKEEKVKALHELCDLRRTPHVHIITNLGVHCKGFRSFV